jgi:hypothetical protein
MSEEFMMNTLINQAIHSNDRENLSPHHESLPGQRSLFAEDDQQHTSTEESAVNLYGELFYTGKDLPGAKESLQAILWDVK